MQRAILIIIIALLSNPISLAVASKGQEIIRYCAKPDLNYQQEIRFGPAIEVALLQGPFMLLERDSDFQLTKQMITQELLNVGIDPDCVEYLMSKSNIEAYDSGELVARVYFAFDQSILTKESKYVLDTIVKKLGDNGQKLILEGHTDNIGTREYNFALGMRRAGRVDEYLVSKQMPKDSMEIVSKGETLAIKTNATAAGRKANRRVDIVAGE